MTTIGDVVSRIRGQVKAEVQDAFVTDRYIYSLILKFAQLLMRRQDHANKLMKFNSVWQTLPYLELIEVDKVEAHCSGIKSGCIIKRSRYKMPGFLDALLEGVFEGDISKWTCDKDDDCIPRYEQQMNIPEFLFAEIETQVLAVIFNTIKVPSEDADNKQNINR